MRIAIIGTGRMGIAQARLARFANDTIAFAVEIDNNARTYFEQQFCVQCYETITATQWSHLDLVWVTVCDDQIETVAQQLSQYLDPNIVVLHTSGLHSSKCLKKHLHRNPCASMHPLMSCPLQTVSDDECYQTYKGVLHTLEGDAVALKTAEYLVERLQGQCAIITEAQKPLYHAAAVFASNYPVVLLQTAIQLLENSGFSHDSALLGARRLFAQAASACQTAEPLDALTGPAKRKDLTTIHRHIEALTNYPDTLETYQTMLKATQKMIQWNPESP